MIFITNNTILDIFKYPLHTTMTIKLKDFFMIYLTIMLTSFFNDIYIAVIFVIFVLFLKCLTILQQFPTWFNEINWLNAFNVNFLISHPHLLKHLLQSRRRSIVSSFYIYIHPLENVLDYYQCQLLINILSVSYKILLTHKAIIFCGYIHI